MSYRSIMSVAPAAILAISLVCSVAIQAGHADVPIAESAQQVTPLGKVRLPADQLLAATREIAAAD